ncbi:TPA: type II secretion system F family protein [Salmonella enterica subsp. enterica serovar 40:-:1,5]|nr:hypothetical protein [Salmonella enterica subsp. enterica]EDM1743931.1 hypothetical protein [Salmonella enterica subsp. enterica serovar Muenchen]HAG1890897.1 hypothetical protein [Salmonella enterica]HAK0844915.1 hypothetical protein [Salmonella enterica]HEC8371896.1 type II secretion system F family protein [Salmonella enterica subsp. enterica serovar Muenchen]
MKYFFALLVLLGIAHLLFLLKQNKRISIIDVDHDTSKTNIISESEKNNIYFLKLVSVYRDITYNLFGKTKKDFIQNILTITVVMSAGFYTNYEYISLSQWVVMPATFILCIYILYIRNKKKKRIEFENGFSEALNIISSSVMAGNSIFQGINQCGKKIPGLVGDELRFVSQRLEIGEDPRAVFMESYSRMPFKEYYFFIVLALNNMKAGGQLKEVISRLSSVISNSRIMDRKKLAKTSEVRMSVKILAAIPAFFVIFLKYQSPDNFDILINHGTGQIIFYYAIGSIMIGLLIIWSMINKV